MSAVMTPRRARHGRRTRPAPAPGAQPALFGAGSVQAAARAEGAVPGPAEPAAVAAPAAPEIAERAVVAAEPTAPEREAVAAPAASPETASPSSEPATTARAHRHGPTLDDLVAGAWEGLLAGAHADCLVCRSPLVPRHSAGAGVVGGRCGSCGMTIG
jgi:hypothetical protein